LSVECGEPAARIRHEWIACHGIRETFEAAATLPGVGASFASGAQTLSVAQRLKEVALVEFAQRCFKQVAHPDRHPAAEEQIAIRLNRDQCIARGAVIRSPARDEELQRAMHGDLGAAKPRAPHWLTHSVFRCNIVC
jgi:hypothetical protein